ncbi:MAG: FAM210 family protein [Proteobacteria bacterium]|nr:FAM210 family protein [Pseudomonadota bacterium]
MSDTPKKTPMERLGELKAKLQEGLEKYGPIAAIVWFTLFFGTWGGIYIALNAGVDMIGVFAEYGIDMDGAAGTTGLVMVAYALSQVTKPIRIVAFLALTPPIAHWWTRRKRA